MLLTLLLRTSPASSRTDQQRPQKRVGWPGPQAAQGGLDVPVKEIRLLGLGSPRQWDWGASYRKVTGLN